ncbi:MAG: hypothetical protein BMS9Abin13_350 [Patescibacteria group bacterium]|nr:MAG: hypothetical protein BMS9Abin13_350 [Patescibacteria group bacterium]
MITTPSNILTDYLVDKPAKDERMQNQRVEKALQLLLLIDEIDSSEFTLKDVHAHISGEESFPPSNGTRYKKCHLDYLESKGFVEKNADGASYYITLQGEASMRMLQDVFPEDCDDEDTQY